MQKIVIKVGTSTLTQGTQKLSRRYMLGLVQQMAHLQNLSIEIILVSSGAVATGRQLLDSFDACLLSKQTCASLGQVRLMQVWSELFSLFDIQVGQMLLTKDDFMSRRDSLTREALSGLLKHHIIPIINENDTVSTSRLSIGNNDMLAALVANLIDADAVILLTDQEGLFTADPHQNPDAKLISTINHIDEKIYAHAGGSSTTLGTGGMITKIEAAQIAMRAGRRVIIASSSRPNVLIDLASGKQIGTTFKKEKTQ